MSIVGRLRDPSLFREQAFVGGECWCGAATGATLSVVNVSVFSVAALTKCCGRTALDQPLCVLARECSALAASAGMWCTVGVASYCDGRRVITGAAASFFSRRASCSSPSARPSGDSYGL